MMMMIIIIIIIILIITILIIIIIIIIINLDGRTILEWTIKKQVSIRGIGLIGLRIGIIVELL